MKQSLLTIRILIVLFCLAGGYLVWLLYLGDRSTPLLAMLIGGLLGSLLILIDVLTKGFSLRALSALTFGLFMGFLAATFIVHSPLFDGGDPQTIYIARLVVYIGFSYLGAVIALRGKDEFNLVIPYVKFEPQRVEMALIVLDTSALVDGRVVKLSQARLLSDVFVAPKFVIDALHALAASDDVGERNRGNRGLQTLSELRSVEHAEVRTEESSVEPGQDANDKLLFVVSSLKGRLLTASESLMQRAVQEGVPCVDILSLTRSLTREVTVGQAISVKLVRLGKEDGQAVGYLEDGSMAVVNAAADFLDTEVLAEVESIIPTSGGRMVFGKLLGENK